MPETALIAIDWGTSAARSYRLGADGRVQERRNVPLGIKHVRDRHFESALGKLIGDWQAPAAPKIACGMIGSRQGWVEVPYVECPASLTALADHVVQAPQDALAIVPGVATRDAAVVAFDDIGGRGARVLSDEEVGGGDGLTLHAVGGGHVGELQVGGDVVIGQHP